MFRNCTSWYIFILSLLELIIKTHPTLHDSSHGFVSKNPRYFDDDLLHLHEELGLLRKSSQVPQKFQLNFEKTFRDFKERSVGQLHLDPLILFSTDTNSSIDKTSVSKNTVQFYNTVFHDRVRGASTLSHYRLRPIVGVKLPLNATFAPLIYLHNSHLEPLQIVEIHSSNGGFNLELPSGEEEGSNYLWEIPPHQTKAIIRVHFLAQEIKNYTADVRIRLHKPDLTLIVPVEVEVTSEAQLIHPRGYLDLGMGGNYDTPKVVKLCLLNPNKKHVRVHSVTAASKAIKVQYYNIRLPPAADSQDPMDQCVDVGTLTIDWKTAYKTKDFSGTIVVKFRNGRNKSEIPYHLNVLKGGLIYDPLTTTYFINDKAEGLSLRSFKVKNQFDEYVYVSDVLLPTDVQSYFKVKVLAPKILKPGEEANIFFIELKNNMRLQELQIQSEIIILTNVSDIRVPLVSYNGKLQVHLPFKSKDYSMDIGLIGFNAKKDAYFMLVNFNPVTVYLKHIHSSIPMTSAEVIGCGTGDHRLVLFSPSFKHLKKCHNMKSGQYAVVKVTVGTTQVEGQVWGDIYVESQYENLKVPVHFKIAPGKLEVGPDKLIFDQCFPGKICSHPLRIYSTFNDPMIIEDILAMPPDKRITSRHTGHIIARTSKIVGHLFFNPDLECRSECYSGMQSDTTAQWLSIFNFSKYVSDFDLHLLNTFYNRYLNVTSHGLKKWQNLTLRLDTSEVKGQLFHSRVKMSWPRLVVDQIPQEKATITFPLTQVGNTTYQNITVRNPASHFVLLQFVFERDYPGFDMLYAAMPPDLVVKSPNDKHFSRGFFFANRTKERQQHLFFNLFGLSANKESMPVLLSPGQSVTIPIGFHAETADLHSTVILVRNNLTILEVVRLNARGVQPMFKFGNRKPGSMQPLAFEMTDRHFHDCERLRLYPEDANFSFKRTFSARNIGDVTVYVNAFYINDYLCEGYGFKVMDCEPFALHPNQTRKIDIAFTPDFTLSKVSRTLILSTSLNVPVNYTLYTTIPPVYLNMCSDAISRPSWEIYLSYLTVASMTILLVVIMCIAAIDAERIRRQAIGSFILPSSTAVQPVLDLRLVGQQTREEIQSVKISPVKDVKKIKEVDAEVKLKPELERYTVLVPTTGKVRKRMGHQEPMHNDSSDIQIADIKEEKSDKRKDKHLHDTSNGKIRTKDVKDVLIEDKDKDRDKNHVKDKEIKKICVKKQGKNNSLVPTYEEETSSNATDSSGGVHEDQDKENDQKTVPKQCAKTKSPISKRESVKNGVVVIIEENSNHSVVGSEFKYAQNNHKFRHQKQVEKKGKYNEKQKKDNKEYDTTIQKAKDHHNQLMGKHVHQRDVKKRERAVKERREKGFHRKSSDKTKQTSNSGTPEKPTKTSPCFNIPLPPPTTINSIWGESCAKFSDVVARNEPTSSFLNAPKTTSPGQSSIKTICKPTMYVEPYKQSSLSELGPIGSRRSDVRRSSAESNHDAIRRNTAIELNGGGLNLLANGLDQERTNSYFSDSIRLDGVGRENGFIGDLNTNGWNPHESFGRVIDTAADGSTVMEDPWNQNLLNTSSYWDSYNPMLGENSLLNGNTPLLDESCLLNENTLIGKNSLLGESSFGKNDNDAVSTASNVYLWGSSSVWQPWAPECTSTSTRTPTRTPPTFDEFLHRNEDSPQPQTRDSYSPFNSSPLWSQQQQTNPWSFSQGQ